MPNRSGWGATALFIVAVLVAVGALALNAALRPTSVVSSVVPLPPAREASAVQLDDGYPVFVVSHADGQVSVLDAFSTHDPSGIYKMLAWCPESRLFTDLVHGGTFDEWGIHFAGPAPANMNAATWTQGSQGEIVVEERFAAVSGSSSRDVIPGAFEHCTFVVHTFAGNRQLSPTQALAQPEGSWVVVAGSLDADGHRLCDLEAACSEAATIDGLELYPEASNRQGIEMWIDFLRHTELWLARIDNHHLAHVTMLGPQATPSKQ